MVHPTQIEELMAPTQIDDLMPPIEAISDNNLSGEPCADNITEALGNISIPLDVVVG